MKNLKSNLMYLANIILGILTYVFLSQSYIGAGVSSHEGYISGYDTIAHYFDGNGTQVMMAISNLLVAILAGLLILSSIYCLLVSLGTVKKSKTFKLMNFANIILSLAFVVFSAISLFCTVGLVNDSSGEIFGVSLGSRIGWAVIVNFVLSILTLLTSILGSKYSKK